MKYIKKLINRIKSTGIKNSVKHYFKLTKNYVYIFVLKIIDYLPLRNIIVFECESDMDDNPRAIYEYVIKEKKYRKYRFVWLVNNVNYCKENYANKNTIFISRFDQTKSNQLKLNYYLSTAKYFLFSHPYWFFKKKEKQIVVHVGHGTPIKHTSKNFNSNCFDRLLVPTKNVLDWYTEFWHCDSSKTFICGLPRNDLLFVRAEKKDTIIKQLIPNYSGEKIIMCMPTYKQSKCNTDSNIEDTYSLGVIETEAQFIKLNEILSKLNIHIIVKIHPLQKIDNLITSNISNIHYIQNSDLFYKNILLYELLGCCDSLLTDVSSVVFDFLLLDRPVAFFMNNYNSYSRGYILDNPIEYMPGVKINTFDDFITYLTTFSKGVDNYNNERKKICEFTNGKNQSNTTFCKDFSVLILK